MTKPKQALWLAGALALGSFASLPLFAQQSDPQQSDAPPSQQRQQPPSRPGDTPAQQQAPDAQDQQGQSNVQVFTGVIAKKGDKYVLQDSASGTAYDIDQQDLAKKYEGQKVRIKGTLDPDGKTIHVK